jgi:protein-disulfide isomerase
MTKDTEATPSVTRRHALLGAAALIAIIAAGGAGYALWGPTDTAAAQTSPAGEVPMADLLVPGPLGDEIQGQADAPVTIVEYASMTCPHCSHFHETTYPELKKKYIDTGKVRFIFREFPLDQLVDRRVLLPAEGVGGAEAPAADARHRQAGRLHRAELQ